MAYMKIKMTLYKTIEYFIWLQTCHVTHLRAKMALISPIKPPPPPPPPPAAPPPPLLRLESALPIGGAGAPSSCWGQQIAKRYRRVQQTLCRHDDSKNIDGCRYQSYASRNNSKIGSIQQQNSICIIREAHNGFNYSRGYLAFNNRYKVTGLSNVH